MANRKQEIGIQVVTDLKQSVQQFGVMNKELLEQKRKLADAKTATGDAAKAWRQAQQEADALRVQVALGKRELEALASSAGKTSVEYLSLKQSLADTERGLKQADASAKTTLATFERQRAATQQLNAAYTANSAARHKMRNALQAEGVDVGKLTNEYQRLEQAQAAAKAAPRLAAEQAAEAKRAVEAMAAAVDRAKAKWAQFAETTAKRQQVDPNMARLATATAEGQAAARAAALDAQAGAARGTLGIRSAADIQADIAKVRAAYRELASSGSASMQELARAELAMRQQIRTLREETMGWGQAISQARMQLLGMGIAGAVALRFGGQGASDLAEYNKQIALVSTLTDKLPGQLAPLGAEIRQLAQDLGVSAKGAAEAAYGIVSSDVAVGQATQVLKQAIMAGIAGVTDTNTAAQVGLGAMHAYGYEVDRLGRIYDILFATVNKGVVTFPELAMQLGDVLSPARSAGVSLETVGAAIATLTLNSVRAPQAVTALKSAILQLAAPTAESKKALEQYGIKWTGLIGTLEQIKSKSLSLDALMKIVGDRDAANGVLVLTQDLDRLKRILGEIEGSSGAFQAAFAKLNGTDDAKIRRFNAAWEDFKMAVGEAVLSAAPLLEAMTRLLRAFNDLPGPVQAMVAATTLGGGAWLVFGRTIRTVGELMGLLRAGLAASSAEAAAAGVAVATAGQKVGTFRLVLAALPAALGWVGAALSLAALSWELFGRKADEAADRTEDAIDRLKRGNADLAASGAQSPDGLAKQAEAQVAALEARRDALNRDIAAARARGEAGNPADLIGLISELDNVERRIAEGRAALERQRSLVAPLPAPTPTGTGGAEPLPPERGKASPYDAMFAESERLNKLPAGLLKAIADVESDFNPKAKNPSGAQGLMQLMPDTASRYGVKDAFDPAQSILGAGRYVAKLFEEMGGDVVKVIAAYNSLSAYKQARAGKFDFAALPDDVRKYVGDVSGKLRDYGDLQIDTQAMEDQARERKKAADDAQKLAEETAQYKAQQDQAAVAHQASLDQQARAQLEADYAARKVTAADYYAKLTEMQGQQASRAIKALAAEQAAEERLQAARTPGTVDYIKGQERILALEAQINQAGDESAAAAQRNRIALEQATRDQTLALGDQLAQVKLRLLEMQQGGRPLADIIIPPESQAVVAQRVAVLTNQYRDLLAQLRQAGNTEGEGLVRQLITAEAVQDFAGKMDQVTEFGVQAARNLQSSMAQFFFDPFKDGVKGLGRGLLDQFRQVASQFAAMVLMQKLVGKDFEKGQLGGLLGDVLGGAKPSAQPGATPALMPEVGPPPPAGAVTVNGATQVPEGAFDGVLGEFEHGFQQIFDGDFFTGIGSVFKEGFGGVFAGLAQIADQLLFGGARSAAGGDSTVGDAMLGIKLAGSLLGAIGGIGGAVGNAAASAGSTNGLGAVGSAMSSAGAGSSWGSSFSSMSMQFHRGGLVGAGGERRALPAITFATAPRYHGGGLAGLRPNEVPAILMGGPKGTREEVVTAADPRHSDNQDRAQSRPAPPAPPVVNVVNVLDPSLVGQYLTTRDGERAILNVIQRNPTAGGRRSPRG